MEGTKLFSATIFLCIILSVQSTNWNKIISTVNSHNGGWEAGLNFSPNISTEYLKTLTGTILEPNERETHPSFLDEISDDDIPAEFDSRKKWPGCKSVINQIRDQGACGSCWAVSAASTFTDRLCISKQETGENTDDYIVSSEEILSCCLVGGCRGGYLIAAWFHIKHGGTVSGGEYGSESGCKPYSIQPCEHRVPGPRPVCSKLPPVSTPKCPNKCTNEKYPISLPKDKVYAKDYHIVKGEQDIQKAILAGGSVQTGFMVYEDFVTYKSGVYRHITGEFLGGHAVRIIGWGVQKNKTKYWLVANSWNTDWGSKGFFKILRGKNECEFESSVYFGVLK